MKGGILFLAFFMYVSIASAVTEYPELGMKQSYLIKDKNITLLGISQDEESALICVNNERAIVSEERTVNGVSISLRSVKNNLAKLKVIYRCSNCVCSDNCSNELCEARKATESSQEESNGLTETTGLTVQEVKNIKVQKDPPSMVQKNPLPMLVSFMFIITITVLILLSKKSSLR